MEIQGKQNLYTENFFDMFFLSSYAMVILNEEGVFVGRVDCENGMLFNLPDNEGLFNLFVQLRDGMERQTLMQTVKLFIQETPEIFIDKLIQEGVLE